MVQHQSYYNHAYDETVANTHSWRTVQNSVAFIMPLLQPDILVLDVGCGPGTITLDLAKYVKLGRIIGVEPTEDILERAELEKKKLGVTNVTFQKGSVYELPFEDNTFDVVFEHQMILHLEDPSKAVQEMRRVTKKGGYMCLKDGDLEGTTIYPSKYESTIKKYMVARDKFSSTNIRCGRSLKELVLKNGFSVEDVVPSLSTWSVATYPERLMFCKMFVERIKNSKEDYKAITSKEEYESVIKGWEEFERDDLGWIFFLHGEVTCKKK